MNKHTLGQIENTFGSILSTSSSLANDNTFSCISEQGNNGEKNRFI